MSQRRGNHGLLRLFKDSDSSTGLSAAILIRNVRPKPLNRNGAMLLVESEFDANFVVNSGGEAVRPRVRLLIYCQPTAQQAARVERNRRRERALARSPILK